MKRVLIITPTNPQDRFSHSGVVYSICKQISKEYDIVWLTPKKKLGGIFLNLLPLCYIAFLKALGYTVSHHPAISKMYAYSLNKELAKIDFDCILGFESIYLSYIKTDKPIIYRTDGVFHSMVGYYIKNVTRKMIKKGDEVEYRALMNASKVLYPSQWVYDETLRYYPKVDANKLAIIESGANIPWVDSHEPRQRVDGDCLQLLFIGSDPLRKGVDVAIECTKYLNEVYQKKATLTIIGGDFNYTQQPYIKHIGKINKNIPEQHKKFEECLLKADLLLFPTRAECAGIVSCEAAAYSIPVIAYNTGGVSSYVIEGQNGHLFDLTATGKDYAEYISELTKKELQKMASNARKLYETKFNWDIWGEKANKIIKILL